MGRPAEAVLLIAALSAGSLVAQQPLERERTVGKVSFRGNHSLDDYTLGISIVTSAPRGFFLLRLLGGGERRPFDELEFRRDVVRLQLLYRQHGYFEARVDTQVQRQNGSVRVTFRISEGPPVIVDTVQIGGVDSILDPARLLRRLPLRAGQPFNRLALDSSADAIANALRNRGRPFPEVYRSYSVDRLTRLARVELEASPGPHARIGEIVVTGSESVTPRTLRRSLGLSEGDEFSQERLARAQLGLYRTDLFRYASVGVAPDSLVGGVDSLVRVRVQLADAPRTRLRAGVGYGTYDCLRTSAGFSRINFLGGARRLDATARVSKIGAANPFDLGLKDRYVCVALQDDPFSDRVNYYGDLSLTQPSLLGRPLALTLSLFGERSSEFNAFERVAAGGVISASAPLGRVPVTLAYRLERGRTHADLATFCVTFDQCDESTVAQLQAYRRQATLNLSALDARTNSPLNPSQGHIFSAQLGTARAQLGSEIVFDRVLAEAVWYRALGRSVVAFRLRAGTVRAGTATIRDTTFQFIPPSERFYAGGPSTVRGFGRNEMGPVVYVRDAATGAVRSSPLGSDGIVLGNLELRAPSPVWAARLGLALFVDAGELWQSSDRGLLPSGLKVTPGVGLRFATPLGPMRLDLGYNRYPNQSGPLFDLVSDSTVAGGRRLVKVQDDYSRPRGTRLMDRLTLHFSVGHAF